MKHKSNPTTVILGTKNGHFSVHSRFDGPNGKRQEANVKFPANAPEQVVACLRKIAKTRGIEALMCSSSMDFPEEYGVSRAQVQALEQLLTAKPKKRSLPKHNLPWTLVNDSGAFSEIYVEPESGWSRKGSVAIIRVSKDATDADRAKARERAKFIAKACNNHHLLLDALEGLVDVLENDTFDLVRHSAVWDEARQAIAMAHTDPPTLGDD